MGGPITGNPSSLERKVTRPGTASTAPDTKETLTPVITAHGHVRKQPPLDHKNTKGTTPNVTRANGDDTPNIRGHPEGGPVQTPGIPQLPVSAEDKKVICMA